MAFYRVRFTWSFVKSVSCYESWDKDRPLTQEKYIQSEAKIFNWF